MQELARPGGSRIAAVVITYNRATLLPDTLRSLTAQTRPVDEIIVVDNGSTDGTSDLLAGQFPGVLHVRLTENTGAAGGMATGLRTAAERGNDWVWLFGDDDLARPEGLETLLAAAVEISDGCLGMIVGWMEDERGHPMTSGARWRHRSIPMPTEGAGGPPHQADHVCMSGSLVSAAMINSVGVPDADLFIMFEEVEYCLRARSAGWRIYVVPRVLATALHHGSAQAVSDWRGYYQTRNHLAMALGRHSPPEVFWWAVRQAKFAITILTSRDRKLVRLRLRSLGAWHAIRGVDGRTVDPHGVKMQQDVNTGRRA